MDGVRLARVRWRLRGAWLWPSFIVLMLVDALVGHALPPAGDAQSLAGAWLVGVWAMLIAVVVLAPAVGALIRRRRTDMPRVVARNYGGTVVIVAVSAVLLAAGLIHQPSLTAGHRALTLAQTRATRWIAAHAPSAFRRDRGPLDTLAIQPGSIYRTCVIGRDHTRTYCVVVRIRSSRAVSVSFAGYEPNSVLSEGVG